jgi:phytoene/squalene synthetase
MIFTTPETFGYYAGLVKTQRRGWFRAAMFLPQDLREAVLAIYSLDIELEHVHHVVKEEMMGHIRYAWWQESIEALQRGVVRDHPLLQALAKITIKLELLLPIIGAYRESFPEYPKNTDSLVEDVLKNYLGKDPGIAKWKKANAIIASHHIKYGQKYDSWLLIKLLLI